MDSRIPERSLSPDMTATPEAIEFVRFCRHRRSVGWPELYDEMCAVAGRGLFRGWSADDLAAHGIGFSLFEMPRLAVIVQQVIADEKDRKVVASMTSRSISRAVERGTAPVANAEGVAPADETSIGGPASVLAAAGA